MSTTVIRNWKDQMAMARELVHNDQPEKAREIVKQAQGSAPTAW